MTSEPETVKRLHQRLSQHLSSEQFVNAAQAVFDTSRYFPTVEEFVSAVKGNAEVNALPEWDLCIQAAARNDREMLCGLSPQGQSALHLVGGLHKLGMATEEQLTWIKKEFVSVWKSSPANIKSLPASRTTDPIELDAVRKLSQQMSFTNNCK